MEDVTNGMNVPSLVQFATIAKEKPTLKKFANLNQKWTLYNVEYASYDDFIVDVIQVKEAKELQDWIIPVKVLNEVKHWKIDSGAQVNCLPLDIYNGLKPKLKTLKTYGGSSIKSHGKTKLTITIGSKELTTKLVLTNEGEKPILRLRTIEAFGLLDKNVFKKGNIQDPKYLDR